MKHIHYAEKQHCFSSQIVCHGIITKGKIPLQVIPRVHEESWQVGPSTLHFCALLPGVNILSGDPLGPSFQQKKIELKSVHKQKS